MAKPKDERQARFVQEYAKDLNATQAAVRAGYSAKTARAQGSRLLTKVDVQQAVGGLLQKLAIKNEITVDRTLQELSRIAFGDIRKLYREDGKLKMLHEMDEEAAAQLAGVETDEEYSHVAIAAVGEDGEPKTDLVPELTITRKVKRWDKLKALDLCMAYLGIHKTTNPTDTGGGLTLAINLSGGKRVR